MYTVYITWSKYNNNRIYDQSSFAFLFEEQK